MADYLTRRSYHEETYDKTQRPQNFPRYCRQDEVDQSSPGCHERRYQTVKLYAIIDRKAKNVVNVFTSLSDEAAERSFLMLLSGPKNIFTDFPEDFDLYPVCELSVGAGLKVSKQGNEMIEAAGFRTGTFDVLEPLKAGVDYDKRYLAMLHHDRFELIKEESEDAPSN